MSIVPKVVYPIHEYKPYEPRDALAVSSKLLLPTFAVGTIFAATRERILHTNSALIPSVLRVGSGAGFITAAAVSFQFVEVASSNLREKEDGWNFFNGGLAAGAAIGLRGGTIPTTVVTSLLIGSIMGLSQWAGGLYFFDQPSQGLEGEKHVQGPIESLFEVKRRVPLSETIQKLGEGRGIFNPNEKKE
ncbi:hypothetical protein V1514DRAFT_364605 [Lipomyces japonicus]|uniref:uncharacterized protein n=1 Tax=Lipomyces japonicus TaxID=56871 RepID=UPI0034CE0BF6